MPESAAWVLAMLALGRVPTVVDCELPHPLWAQRPAGGDEPSSDGVPGRRLPPLAFATPSGPARRQVLGLSFLRAQPEIEAFRFESRQGRRR